MTLAELARSAGVWVETLQVFLRRGMLPAASDDGFGESHLEVVRWIGRMQAEHQLTLDALSGALVDADFSTAVAEESLMALVQPDPTRAGPGPASLEALRAKVGASEALLERLIGRDLIPGVGPYGGHHLWIVEAAIELERAGMDPDATLALGRIGLEIAEAEVDAVISQVGRGATPAQALVRTRERRAAVGRLVSVARHGATRALMARLANASDGGQRLVVESIHTPSPLFLARYRLDASLATLAEAAQRSRTLEEADPTALLEHGRLLLGVGRFEEATAVLAEAADLRATEAVCSNLAISLGISGRDDEALAAADRAVALAPDSQRAQVFRAVTYAMAAAAAGDLLVAAARIHEAIEGIARSRSCRSSDPGEALEAAVARGRLCTVMPEAFGLREQGIADLRRVLEDVAEARDGELGLVVPGSRDLVRINAMFYLGMALCDARGQEEAQSLLSEVVALDPVSAYATRAWQTLQHPG